MSSHSDEVFPHNVVDSIEAFKRRQGNIITDESSYLADLSTDNNQKAMAALGSNDNTMIAQEEDFNCHERRVSSTVQEAALLA